MRSAFRPSRSANREETTLRTISAALVLLAALSTPLQAQQLPPSFASLGYARDTAPTPLRNFGVADETRTYWVEGALIVGIPFALLGAGLGGTACSGDSSVDDGPCWDNQLLGLVVGFGTGASLGALIGGQIKKGEKRR